MQSRNKFKRIVCIALAVIMTLSLVSTALILMVNAASSKEIEKELVDLRAQQAELKKQSDALKAEINQNEAETQTQIEKKADIDKQMDMSRQTIENLNAQIQQYSLLIADKQSARLCAVFHITVRNLILHGLLQKAIKLQYANN